MFILLKDLKLSHDGVNNKGIDNKGIYIASAPISAKMIDVLFSMMEDKSQSMTIDSGRPIKIGLYRSSDTIAYLKNCIKESRVSGKVFNLDIDPATQFVQRDDKAEYDWQSAGPWWIALRNRKSCDMDIYKNPLEVISEKGSKFELEVQGEEYKIYMSRGSKKNIFASTITISLDGAKIGSLPGKKYKTDVGSYGTSAVIPIELVTALFKKLQDGAKILTVDAGEPIQFQLSDSDQALKNLQACWDLKASLESGATKQP